MNGDRPSGAYVLSLIGGIFIIIGAILVVLMGVLIGGYAFYPFYAGGGVMFGFGIVGLVFGILIVIGAVMAYDNPKHCKSWGTLILVFSILSWFFALAGFLVGFLLALIGGILFLDWKPSAQRYSGSRLCMSCGRVIPYYYMACPYCGTGLPPPHAYWPQVTPQVPQQYAQAPTYAPPQAQQTCTKCGSGLPMGVRFCPNCGAPTGQP